MIHTPRQPRRDKAMSSSYFTYVRRHPLTSIRNEAELDAAQAMVDALLQQDLDAGGQAYLDALSDLIILYERDHHPVSTLPPNELLAELLKEHGLSQADLGRATGLAKATVSDLVTGKRTFTVEQMHTVARVFNLPGSVFLGTGN
jgi:HTH-type transcriptional regulator/antitoxin HigA